MTTSFSTDLVAINSRGEVTAAEADYAKTRIAGVVHYARDPVLFARVKLARLTNPALTRPAVAQVNLDYNGRLLRAQVARPTMREAVDEVHDRLRDRLQRAAGHWEAIRGERPSPEQKEWRHKSVPTERAPFFPRPPEERQVLRHKAYSLPVMTADEAAFDMDMLDYDFMLFTEIGSGVDSVLYRTENRDYRLAQLKPRPDGVAPGVTPVTVSGQPAARLDVEQAVERLNVTALQFVFFRDAGTGRGCVLYHRYDGHYGLITTAD